MLEIISVLVLCSVELHDIIVNHFIVVTPYIYICKECFHKTCVPYTWLLPCHADEVLTAVVGFKRFTWIRIVNHY